MNKTNTQQLSSISLRVKELRQGCSLTQMQVASKLGITYQSYQAYEHGTALPSLDTLINMAKLFDVSCDYILGVASI